MIGGGDWGEDRLLPDLMRAALAGQTLRVRNPNSIRPWQHVLNPLSGYLVLAQALWDSPEHARGWNFGPPEEDARSVGWIVERVGGLWPGTLAWSVDDGPHPHEARYLKLDCPDEIRRAVREQLREGADMRAVTLGQIESFGYAGARS